ncbi:MAG: hypothetical protein SGI96_07260 [Bacteroidota bacterium]|nr:hypothetical protein [Bacteroidota bacterium]
MKPIKGGKHPVQKNEVDEMLKLMADMLNGGMGKPKPNTTGISYSSLILQLIKPYQQSTENMPVEELEYLLDMGMTAWNLSVYKQQSDFLYQSYLQAVNSTGLMDKAGEKLLKQLEADKEKLFGQYNDMLLEDFEITEDANGRSVINIISKPVDNFLQESLMGGLAGDTFEPSDDKEDNFMEEEDDELPPYVLPVINRNVVIIKPRAPFMDWLRKMYFPEEPPQLSGESTVYLLPEYETVKETEKYVKKNFDRIFGSELWSWDTEEKNWPAKRNYKLFTEWFDIKFSCMAYDMANYPVIKD